MTDSHHHASERKYDIATHASLPMLVMLFIQMATNMTLAQNGIIFISPYLLAFLTACFLLLIVFWKGQICPGQTGRLTFVLRFFLIFALGNLAYGLAFTPKYIPMTIVGVSSLILPLIFWTLPNKNEEEEKLRNASIYCGFGLTIISVMLYLVAYGVVAKFYLPHFSMAHLPPIMAQLTAQLLLGLILAGWYLMLAKSRLEMFLKWLVKWALILLVINYVLRAWALYLQLQQSSVAIFPTLLYLAVQFCLLAIFAWLLLGKGEKQIKNPVGWTIALFLAMLYPLANS